MTPIRAVLHAFALVIFTSTIPALRGSIERRATPWAFVLTTLLRPVPLKRTATPSTGFRECVTFATTSWRLPFALTIPGVTSRTRQMFTCGRGFGFETGLGVGAGAAGGVAGAVTSVDASSVLFAPFVSLPFPVAVAELTNVPVWPTRAESPIVRSTPGPSVSSEQLSSVGVRVHEPASGCCVTVTNVTPLGAASTSVTSCA